MSWYIYPTKNDSIEPQADQGLSNSGLTKFFLPLKQFIRILPFQSKRVDTGWSVSSLANGYSYRTYTPSILQKLGCLVVPQLVGLNGSKITVLIRNITNKIVQIRGGSHILSTLMNTLSHVQPTVVPAPQQEKKNIFSKIKK